MEFQRLYNNICCALLQCMLRAKVGEKRLKVFELYVTGLQSFDKNENKKNKTKQNKKTRKTKCLQRAMFRDLRSSNAFATEVETAGLAL